MSVWAEKRPSGASQIAGDGRFFASFDGPQNGSLVNCGRASRRNMTESQWQKALTSQVPPEKKGPDETTFVVCFQATPNPNPHPHPNPNPNPRPHSHNLRRRELPARAWAYAGARQASAHAACPAQTSKRPAVEACFHYDFHLTALCGFSRTGIYTAACRGGFPAAESVSAGWPNRTDCMPCRQLAAPFPPPRKSGHTACGEEAAHGQNVRWHSRPATIHHGCRDSAMRLQGIAASSGLRSMPSHLLPGLSPRQLRCQCRRTGPEPCPRRPKQAPHGIAISENTVPCSGHPLSPSG